MTTEQARLQFDCNAHFALSNEANKILLTHSDSLNGSTDVPRTNFCSRRPFQFGSILFSLQNSQENYCKEFDECHFVYTIKCKNSFFNIKRFVISAFTSF